MKIQKRFLRNYNGKDYYKFVVNIPEVILIRSGFKANDEFEFETKKDEIILKKKKSGK